MSDYLSAHPNLWSGEPEQILFRCPAYLMSDVVDWFGKNIGIRTVEPGQVEVKVMVSEESILHWAVQYAESVEVISPKKLRKRIADTLREALKKSEKGEGKCPFFYSSHML